MFGFGIYSTITVLPLFYQDLLGYTALAAGFAVAPRGIGSICAMPVIGYLSGRLEARYLMTVGFLTFGFTTLYFGSVTTDISPTTLLLPIMITGFGLSFVFVPINTAAYGTLQREQIGNATGLFSLMRNIGGSIGISVATTLLTRRAAAHQNALLNYIPQTGQAFQQALGDSRQFLTMHFGPANSLPAAQQYLYKQLGAQSLSWAFVDVFRWLSLVLFAGTVLVWLLEG